MHKYHFIVVADEDGASFINHIQFGGLVQSFLTLGSGQLWDEYICINYWDFSLSFALDHFP